jgi:antirestriction protein ArdC
MATKFNPKEIPTKIAEQFIGILTETPEKWHKAWESFGATYQNPISGTSYKGGNIVSCWVNQMVHGFESNNFITFNAAKQLAAEQIEGFEEKISAKGKKYITWEGEGERPNIIDPKDLKEKACTIYFWKYIEKLSKTKTNDDGTPKKVRFPMLRCYFIYNVELFNGITIPNTEEIFEPNLIVENKEQKNFFLNMNNGPKFGKSLNFNPCYNRVTDLVKMPTVGQFETWSEYISTLAHEYIHATGHTSRLNRKTLMGSKSFDEKANDYPLDELVAELGAAMFAAKFGVLEEIQQNAKNYLGGWIRRLKDFDSDGKKHFMWAVNQAHKAFMFINDNQPNG